MRLNMIGKIDQSHLSVPLTNLRRPARKIPSPENAEEAQATQRSKRVSFQSFHLVGGVYTYHE
jgi:hypothetical protein